MPCLNQKSIHHIHLGNVSQINSEELQRVYSILKEGGFLSFEQVGEDFYNSLKITGFTKITQQAAGKPKWGNGGSLKKKPNAFE